MADITVESLAVAFGVESSGFEKGLKKVEGAAKATQVSVLKYLGPIAGLFAGGKLWSSFLATDQLGKFAKSIGENVKDIDSWGKAVEDAGGSAQGFQSTVSNLSKGLVEAAKLGSGRAKAALDAFGISARDAGGQTKKATDVLFELSRKAESIGYGEFYGLAKKLGLDEGTIGLLQQGNEELQKQLEIFSKNAVTEKNTAAAARFNTAWQKVKNSIESVSFEIFTLLEPALTKLLNILEKGTNYLKDNEIEFNRLLGVITAIVASKAIPGLAGALRGLWIVLAANPIGALIVLIGLFWQEIQDFYLWTRGHDSYIGRLVGPVEDIFDPLIDKIIEFKDKSKESFGPIAPIITTLIELWEEFTQNIVDGQGPVEAFGNAFVAVFKRMRDSIIDAIKKINSILPAWLTSGFGLGGYATQQIGNLFSGGGGDTSPAYLAAAGLSSNAYTAPSTEISTTISNIEINTQATDAAGIARDLTADLFGQNIKQKVAMAGKIL